MLCAWILSGYLSLNQRYRIEERWKAFVEKHLVADDPDDPYYKDKREDEKPKESEGDEK